MGGGRDFTTGQSIYIRRNGAYERRDGKLVNRHNKGHNEQYLVHSSLIPDNRKTMMQNLLKRKHDGKMSGTVQRKYGQVLDIFGKLEEQKRDSDILEIFSNLSENEMSGKLLQAKNTDMKSLPEQLQIGGDDFTQKLVHDLGLNGKPLKISHEDFETLIQNGIFTQSDILTRSVHDKDVLQDWVDSDLNYISGRFGGSWYGHGQYFAFNNGHNTGYGDYSMNALLRPDAKVINYDEIGKVWANLPWDVRTAIGSPYKNESLVALASGYQAIYDKASGNVCVIDRSALIVEDRIFTD